MLHLVRTSSDPTSQAVRSPSVETASSITTPLPTHIQVYKLIIQKSPTQTFKTAQDPSARHPFLCDSCDRHCQSHHYSHQRTPAQFASPAADRPAFFVPLQTQGTDRNDCDSVDRLSASSPLPLGRCHQAVFRVHRTGKRDVWQDPRLRVDRL